MIVEVCVMVLCVGAACDGCGHVYDPCREPESSGHAWMAKSSLFRVCAVPDLVCRGMKARQGFCGQCPVHGTTDYRCCSGAWKGCVSKLDLENSGGVRRHIVIFTSNPRFDSQCGGARAFNA